MCVMMKLMDLIVFNVHWSSSTVQHCWTQLNCCFLVVRRMYEVADVKRRLELIVFLHVFLRTHVSLNERQCTVSVKDVTEFLCVSECSAMCRYCVHMPAQLIIMAWLGYGTCVGQKSDISRAKKLESIKACLSHCYTVLRTMWLRNGNYFTHIYLPILWNL